MIRTPFRMMLLTLVLLAAVFTAVGADAAEPPRYNADNFSVAAFANADDRVDVWGNCDEDGICQRIASINPLNIEDYLNVAVGEANVGWYVVVVELENNDDTADAIYRVNVFDANDLLQDNELTLRLHEDGSWSMQDADFEDMIFTGNIQDDE